MHTSNLSEKKFFRPPAKIIPLLLIKAAYFLKALFVLKKGCNCFKNCSNITKLGLMCSQSLPIHYPSPQPKFFYAILRMKLFKVLLSRNEKGLILSDGYVTLSV